MVTENPGKSARIANTLAGIYLDDQIRSKLEATEGAVTWLSERLVELEAELQEREDAIEALRAEADFVSPEGLAALNAQAREARGRLDLARADEAAAACAGGGAGGGAGDRRSRGAAGGGVGPDAGAARGARACRGGAGGGRAVSGALRPDRGAGGLSDLARVAGEPRGARGLHRGAARRGDPGRAIRTDRPAAADDAGRARSAGGYIVVRYYADLNTMTRLRETTDAAGGSSRRMRGSSEAMGGQPRGAADLAKEWLALSLILGLMLGGGDRAAARGAAERLPGPRTSSSRRRGSR